MSFESAFTRLIDVEKGFQADPRDRGNWTGGEPGRGLLKGTKFGISAAAYPSEDIEHLTLERAQLLYRRDYWGPAGCDAVPDGLKFDLFDFAVNSGVGTAVRALQRAVGTVDDGRLGPHSLQAIHAIPAPRLAAHFAAQRLMHLAGMPRELWAAFGPGLVKRVAGNLMAV
jgi:lysozyme family protein